MAAIPLSTSTKQNEKLLNANDNRIILDTIELLNPLFKNEQGDAISLRFVNDSEELIVKESDGTLINYSPQGFRCQYIPKDTTPYPTFSIEIDNVSGYLMPYLDQSEQQDIFLIYRLYVMSITKSLKQKSLVMLKEDKLKVNNVSLDIQKVNLQANFIYNLADIKFPNEYYGHSYFIS